MAKERKKSICSERISRDRNLFHHLQVRRLVAKVSTKDVILYRKMTDKPENEKDNRAEDVDSKEILSGEYESLYSIKFWKKLFSFLDTPYYLFFMLQEMRNTFLYSKTIRIVVD